MLEITKIQIEQARIMSENQQKSEQRITNLIMEMQSKKPALSEIMEVVEFVDTLKHGGGAVGEGDTILEKLLNSPALTPLIQGIIAKAITPAPAAPSAATVQAQGPAIVQAVQAQAPQAVREDIKKLTAADFFEKIPDEFKAKVTQENRDEMAKFIYDNNMNTVDFQTASDIIEMILQEKAKAK